MGCLLIVQYFNFSNFLISEILIKPIFLYFKLSYVIRNLLSYIAETWDMHGYPRHTTYFPGWRERKRTNFNFIDNHSLNTSKQNHSILRYRRYATTIKFDLRHQLFLKKKNKTIFSIHQEKNFHVAGKRGGDKFGG